MPAFVKKHLLILVIAGVGLVILLLPRQDHAENNYETVADSAPRPSNEDNTGHDSATPAMVDVKGEVKNPGVYEVDLDTRVNDVIDEAGGFTEKALESAVNLAQKVHDEMVIVVPDENGPNEGTIESSSGTSKVRINQATQEDVETLSGIGPSKAAAIIDHRDEHGPFQSVEDLLEVSGIGEKTLKNLKADIQIP